MGIRLTRGQRVGGRYRLERELGRGSGCVTWEALDERLDRSVAVRIFDAGMERSDLVRRAGLAASLAHPRVVRVFDTGQDDGRFFTVSELLPASLRTVRLPLPADQALRTAIDVTEGLEYAHERGVVHGHLHEGNVFLSENGAKVGDFALAVPRPAERADDLRALGALLHRAVVSPTASPSFTRVIEGLAGGAYESAANALTDLKELRPPPAAPERQPVRRSWFVAIVVGLVAVAVFGITRLGGQSPQTSFAPGGRIEGTPLRVANVDDFDPLCDRREKPATVGTILDGNPQTFWSTERYRNGPKFDVPGCPQKTGVGLVLDLGKIVKVGKAQLLFPARGCSFELRYTGNTTKPVGDWGIAASVAKSPTSAPIVFDAAKARYWLLWFTALTKGVPGAGSSWGCAVSEVDLFGP